MPVINTYDTPAGKIRVGNYLFGQRVVKVVPKRVNTVITLDEPVCGYQEYTFKLTDMLEVGMEEKTLEEIAAHDAEMLELQRDGLVSLVRGWVKDADDVVEAADQYRAERLAKGWEMLDHWSLDRQLAAYAKHDVIRNHVVSAWDAFDAGKIHKHDAEHHYGDDGKCVVPSDSVTEYQMAVQIVEDLIGCVVSLAMGRRVLSRSTSLTSNLVEDLRAEAFAGMVKDVRYVAWGLPELAAHRTLINSH